MTQIQYVRGTPFRVAEYRAQENTLTEIQDVTGTAFIVAEYAVADEVGVRA